MVLRAAEIFRPYLNLLYLNHGYSFFAPEPGPSYVMEFEVERKNGEKVTGRLPDLAEHWPRLLYHRYFMLATQNPGLMADAEASGKARPESTNTLAHAIAEHLNRIHGGRQTTLRLFVHRLLWPEEVLSGKSPEARDTYALVGEIRFPPSTQDRPLRPGDGTQRDSLRLEEVRP
jgi:hypothetical protein